jgi:hypothetical protein
MKLFEENFLPMMTKLGQLTSFKGDIMKSEAAQLRCLEQLHVMLQPKDDGKGYQRAINIAKVKKKKKKDMISEDRFSILVIANKNLAPVAVSANSKSN